MPDLLRWKLLIIESAHSPCSLNLLLMIVNFIKVVYYLSHLFPVPQLVPSTVCISYKRQYLVARYCFLPHQKHTKDRKQDHEHDHKIEEQQSLRPCLLIFCCHSQDISPLFLFQNLMINIIYIKLLNLY